MNGVEEFINTKNKLMEYFKCVGEYFVKPALDCNWRIKENGGNFFISYWNDGARVNECVIVKKNNRPMIYKREEFTMVVCIECVKIALILRNIKNI